MKKIVSVLLIVSMLIMPASGVYAKEQYEVTSMYTLGWENTWETFSERKWEISITDYNSEKVVNTTTYSTTVRASSASEAVAVIEAGASAGIKYSGLSASLKAGTKIIDKITGKVTYEFTVTGKKEVSYIQYYDLYSEYMYSYYIYNLVDENGNVHDVDYTGQFRYKTATGNTKVVASRRAAY